MGIPTMVMVKNVRPQACVEIDMELLNVADGWAGTAEDLRSMETACREELQGMSEALAAVYSIMVRSGVTGNADTSRSDIDAMRRSIMRTMQENGGKYEYVGSCGNVLCVLDMANLKVHFRAKLMHNKANSDTIRDAIMFRSSADMMVYALHVPVKSLVYKNSESYQSRDGQPEASNEHNERD